MDAEDLLLRQFLGIRDEKTTQAAALFIRGEQREDGTWATFYGGPGELSATIEAYVALRLAGDAPDAPHMAKASAWIREQGGIAAARVFTRIWLALFGWWKWEDLPELPPELIYFPKWMPLNIYDFGCWARQTIVPLTIVSAKRPVRPAPFPLDELHTDPSDPNPAKPLAPVASWDGAFQRLDKALHALRKVAPRRLRRAAMNSAARWIIERQENDGCWGGIQPPAVYSIIALHLLGYDLEHPVMREGLASLDRFAVWREDGARMIEACQSPVWDTCLAAIALVDAGLPADHPQLVKAADWMLGEEIVRPGDWSVQAARTAARRLGVRVPQRQLPRHRRHRRGGPRAAPGHAPRPGAAGEGHRARRALEPRHAVEERRVGRLRRRQHQPVPQPAAVLRLRRGHRPAVRRRHRARRRDARGRGPGPRPAHPARHRVAAGRTGAGRLVVRALGRQLRLRHRIRRPRPGGRRASPPRTRRSGAP